MMSLHAHLSKNEVIGYLAGKWISGNDTEQDAKSLHDFSLQGASLAGLGAILLIEQAYPCDSIAA